MRYKLDHSSIDMDEPPLRGREPSQIVETPDEEMVRGLGSAVVRRQVARTQEVVNGAMGRGDRLSLRAKAELGRIARTT